MWGHVEVVSHAWPQVTLIFAAALLCSLPPSPTLPYLQGSAPPCYLPEGRGNILWDKSSRVGSCNWIGKEWSFRYFFFFLLNYREFCCSRRTREELINLRNYNFIWLVFIFARWHIRKRVHLLFFIFFWLLLGLKLKGLSCWCYGRRMALYLSFLSSLSVLWGPNNELTEDIQFFCLGGLEGRALPGNRWRKGI